MFRFNSGEKSISFNHQINIPEEDLMQIMDINYGAAATDPLRMMIPIHAAATDTIQPDMNLLPPLPYKITASSNEENRGPEDENCRKKKHREIEKQRRQEMASLFGDLRSLLPLEFIRGKRSKPDQMNETVNYIRHLQAEIKDLQLKRDKMKKTTNLTCPDSPYGSVSSSIIVVFPWCDGVQIMIRQGSREGVFPLSAVMKLLAQEGVNVVTCSSSQVEN